MTSSGRGFRALSARTGSPIDPALVEQARRGDDAAFGVLFQRTADDVGRYIAAILRDRDRAEDALADTYLAAWRQLPKLREPDRFEAWLFRIAHNRAIDALRAPQAEPLPETDLPVADVGPEGAVLQRERIDHLRVALLRLPSDQREIITLRYLRGASHAEIAKQIGKSEGASRVALHRAVESLRRAMEDHDAATPPAASADSARTDDVARPPRASERGA